MKQNTALYSLYALHGEPDLKNRPASHAMEMWPSKYMYYNVPTNSLQKK
jgi:hypothetical protein